MRAPGLATPEGTAAFAERFRATAAPGHYRLWNRLTLSSIGLGTYLGPHDDATDALYRASIRRALDLGCNVIDTAVNYRYQRSERAVGEALAEAFGAGLARDAIVVSTKGGFFPFDGHPPADPAGWIEETYVRRGIVASEEIAAGCHCISPAYLKNQLDTSLRNLRLEAVDIYYLHNPETQLDEVDRGLFLDRMRSAFAFLENAAAEGKIGVYGTATWNGYRQAPGAREHLSLSELARLAREVGGEEHRFRAIQLPINLAMPEAIVRRNQKIGEETLPLVEAASRLGMIVMSSGSIYQGQLARELPESIVEILGDLDSDAQRALQYPRSTPGVTTALVGMKTTRHVEENLALASHPPASPERYARLLA